MEGYELRRRMRKARFVERWRARIDEVRLAIDRLPAANGRFADELLQISRAFHQFCGGGGIYDLGELCAIAMAAEDRCSVLLRTGAAPQPVDLDYLKTQAEAMRLRLAGLSESE